MAHAYTPGLRVARSAEIRTRRILPIAGDVLVARGARVAAEQIVARALLPGAVTPINVAQRLGVSGEDVAAYMCVREGEAVRRGAVLAQRRALFGLLRSAVRCPADTVVERISGRTGQVMLRHAAQPLELDAYIAGEIIDVVPGEGVEIAAHGSIVQGIFGVGGERRGRVRMAVSSPAAELAADAIGSDAQGAVLVGGAYAGVETFHAAQRAGAAALVIGGFDDADLRAILGHDVGVAVTGQEPLATTLILTEGFGRMPMAAATFDLLASLAGRLASVNGATQIRAGVLRPEILVPLDGAGAGADGTRPTGRLLVGSRVRIIREPLFGAAATVRALPAAPEVIATGATVRVLRAALDDGRVVTLPRANVEIVED